MTVYTVSQVTQYIRGLLVRDEILGDLLVTGEVSNFRVSQSGHAYFTIKDADSQLRCVMFRNGVGMDLLDDGGAVTAHGHVSFYEARGSLDFVSDMVMAEGVGPLAMEFERLKAALEREGLFDPSRKRELPRFPRAVGVVTSPTGAVFHDICNVLSRRYPLVEVILAPTLVQGPGAAKGIQRALVFLNQEARADLIVLARGGGSLEDLWPFNEEAVARAIYASRIPVVSAVGHETDFTISDLVADVRAPTPSAAAELIVPDASALAAEIDALFQRMAWSMAGHQADGVDTLSDLVSHLNAGIPDVNTLRRHVDDISHSAARAMSGGLSLKAQQIFTLERQMSALSPSATLIRGYAVVQKENAGEVVSSQAQVKANESLKITVADGDFPALGRPSKPAHQTKKEPKKEKIVADGRLFP